jgi:hypothetical protein
VSEHAVPIRQKVVTPGCQLGVNTTDIPTEPQVIMLDPTGVAYCFPVTPLDYLALAVQIVETCDMKQVEENDTGKELKERLSKALTGGIIIADAARAKREVRS